MEVELPIRMLAIFETYCITLCFNRYEEMESWNNEHELELKKVSQCGNFLCCIAAEKNTKLEEVL